MSATTKDRIAFACVMAIASCVVFYGMALATDPLGIPLAGSEALKVVLVDSGDPSQIASGQRLCTTDGVCVPFADAVTINVDSGASSPALEGVYTLVGANPDGEAYAGVLEIQKQDDAYLCLWTLGKDSEGKLLQAMGYGFLDGATFVVGIVSPDGGSLTVAIYTKGDEQWKGRWSAAGSGSISDETLTRSDKDAKTLIKSMPTPGGRAL